MGLWCRGRFRPVSQPRAQLHPYIAILTSLLPPLPIQRALRLAPCQYDQIIAARSCQAELKSPSCTLSACSENSFIVSSRLFSPVPRTPPSISGFLLLTHYSSYWMQLFVNTFSHLLPPPHHPMPATPSLQSLNRDPSTGAAKSFALSRGRCVDLNLAS